MSKTNTPILIFTGGHHTSGLEVAKKLLSSSNAEIIWMGHRYSSWGDNRNSAEYREVTGEKIPFIDLKAGKFHRTYNPLKLIRIPWGFIQSLYHLITLKLKYRNRTLGIVSFGGYLAVPVVICGFFLGIPSLTHEQTMVSGWANRLIALFCKKIAISWTESKAYLPGSKCVSVGLSIRDEILKLDHDNSSKRPAIYVTGGKQGSHAINKVIFEILPQILNKYDVIHQTGANSKYNDHQKSLKVQSPHYFPYEYTDPKTTGQNLQKSEIVISRSGAHIIAELLYFQRKSVLIPIPWGSHREQEVNAAYLEKLNQAIVLPQSQLTVTNLISAIHKAERLKPEKAELNFNGLDNYVSLIKSELLT